MEEKNEEVYDATVFEAVRKDNEIVIRKIKKSYFEKAVSDK
jgi:hypothetical protein